MLKQFWTIFAKSKGDNSALTKAIRVKLVFAHSLLKINIFAKYQVNQFETEGKGKQSIIFYNVQGPLLRNEQFYPDESCVLHIYYS